MTNAPFKDIGARSKPNGPYVKFIKEPGKLTCKEKKEEKISILAHIGHIPNHINALSLFHFLSNSFHYGIPLIRAIGRFL